MNKVLRYIVAPKVHSFGDILQIPLNAAANNLYNSLVRVDESKHSSIIYKVYHLQKQSLLFHVNLVLVSSALALWLHGKVFEKISQKIGDPKIDDPVKKYLTFPNHIEDKDETLSKIITIPAGPATCVIQDRGDPNETKIDHPLFSENLNREITNPAQTDWGHFQEKKVYPIQRVVDFFHATKILDFIHSLPILRKQDWKVSSVELKTTECPDYWENTDQLIADLIALKTKHFRLSIERSAFEKSPGQYDETVIEEYRELFQKLFEAGIEPNVTIHHFSDPQWFVAKGGWEKEENVTSFVDFSLNVMPKILEPYTVVVDGKVVQKSINYVATFNEIAASAFEQYIHGEFPPAKFLHFKTSARVIRNKILAHNLVYEGLKEKYPDVKIGMTHNVLNAVPANKYNPFAQVVARAFSYILNGVIINMIHGESFSYKLPFIAHITDKKLKLKTDWIGVQYYVRPLLSMTRGSTCEKGGKMVGAMPFRFDPEGLLPALKQVDNAIKAYKQKFNHDVEIQISESGIADPREGYDENTSLGQEYLQKVLQVLSKAISIGIPVTRYYYWTLYPNWEWGRNSADFGLYQEPGKCKAHGKFFKNYNEEQSRREEIVSKL